MTTAVKKVDFLEVEDDFQEEWFDLEDQDLFLNLEHIETHDSFDHFIEDPQYSDKYETFSLEDF